MTNNTTVVLNGFMKLTAAEKQELIEAINGFYQKNDLQKGMMNESLSAETRKILGPTSGNVCRCCGR
jgi:hypothetical protein